MPCEKRRLYKCSSVRVSESTEESYPWFKQTNFNQLRVCRLFSSDIYRDRAGQSPCEMPLLILITGLMLSTDPVV